MDCAAKHIYYSRPLTKSSVKLDHEAEEVDTNVIRIDYSTLNKRNNFLLKDDLLYCQQCQACFNNYSEIYNKEEYEKKVAQNPLNQVSDVERAVIAKEETKANDQAGSYIDNLKNDESVWICEFCHYHNRITQKLNLRDSDDTFYLLEQADAKEEMNVESTNVEGDDVKLIFCIDTSGSMSTYHNGKNGGMITRLNAIKDSVKEQIAEMAKSHPRRKVGLVFFGATVTLKGDCSGPEISITNKSHMDNFEKLFDDSRESSALLMKKEISQCEKSLLRTVEDVQSGGNTALGPALVCALGLCMGKPGSKIILCTDGLANQGLGNVEDGSKLDESIKFYDRVGDVAVENGISVSVVTIKGNACKVEMLGPLTDRTAGVITRVDPTELDFKEMTKEVTIATKVELKVLLHAGLAFRNESASNLKNDGSLLFKNIGNVTDRNSTTVEYRVKTSNEIKQQKIDIAELKFIPMQAQISFVDPKGNKWIRVITKRQEITEDKEVVEKDVEVDVLAGHAQKQAAEMALKGDVKGAQMKNKAWQKFVVENKNLGANMDQKEREEKINMWAGQIGELDDLMNEASASKFDQAKKDDFNTKLWGVKQKK